MVVNSVRVKEKTDRRRRFKRVHFSVLIIAAVIFAAALPFAYDLHYGRLGIIYPQPVIEASGAGRIIKVPPGGHVQSAIEKANGGDIVELQAGAVYSGEIKLPNKPLSDFITIQSSAVSKLPADKRVSPAQRSLMATITSGMLGKPAVSASNGAHHYRFIGIEFTASGSGYNYGLVVFGSEESNPERLPHDLEIDRSYIHPFKSGVVRRGIALNSGNTTIKNSYIEGIGFPGEETQGICGWTGTRNVRILNNYIEGGAENIMFGGGDPASVALIPFNIEVRDNHLNKPEAWKEKVSVKTLFELKNAKHVQFIGNLLTNNWKGSAFRITVRNQDNGAPFSTIEDVVIKDNVIDGAGAGINILGKDDTYPSQTLKRLVIENNLFLNIRGGNGFEGNGYFVQIADGEDITIVNNTAFSHGNIVTFYGAEPRGFLFRDNIANHGEYGVHGLADRKSAAAQAMFQNNIFLNLNRIDPSGFSFPPGNTLVPTIDGVGFIDAPAKDFRLAPDTKFKSKTGTGKNIGSNLFPVQ